METSTPPHPAINLSNDLYLQLVHTLTDLLPPPLDGSPDALRARNHAAIAKVAALLPVNANEADLAAQCIAARAQAEDILRLLRENAHDLALVIRLNPQYASMVRTSLSVHARLMRAQAVRQKREAIEGAANQDSWTQHAAQQSMLQVADPDIERLTAAQPKAAPVNAPAIHTGQAVENNISENETNSQGAAFETWLTAQLQDLTSVRPDGGSPHAVGREVMAESRSAGRDAPANSRETPASTGQSRMSAACPDGAQNSPDNPRNGRRLPAKVQQRPRNGLTMRSPSLSVIPSCISSDHKMSQSACSADAAIIAS
jgi:hypothetical protein